VQVKAWGPQLEKVLDFFSELQAVPLDDVPLAVRAPGDAATATARKDVVQQHPMADTFLDSVPEREGNFIRVPRMLADVE
jgi:aspartyl-tRNA(Asn)/glutamyl-tRNA(Gln) amidotransferase subunit C